MKIGCTKEIKNNEFRVGITPDNARAYIAAGHEVYIEKEKRGPATAPDSATTSIRPQAP